MIWQFNPLFTEFHFLEVVLKLRMSAFPLLLQATLSISSFWVHDLGCTHPSATLQWSGLSGQQMFLQTENCLQWQKRSSYKGRGVVSTLVYTTRTDQSFSTVKTAGMCHPVEVTPTHHSLSHLFVSPKSIFKTDCGQSCMILNPIKWLKEGVSEATSQIPSPAIRI